MTDNRTNDLLNIAIQQRDQAMNSAMSIGADLLRAQREIEQLKTKLKKLEPEPDDITFDADDATSS